LIDKITSLLKALTKILKEEFKDNLKCIIIYGSWAKGTAKENSDVDLIAVFEKVDNKTRRKLHETIEKESKEKSITIVPASIEDFKKERLPLFTVVKREGIIIYGNIDLNINPAPPSEKYKEFFKKSEEFEKSKVKIAEEIFKNNPEFTPVDLCFVASKHAIQVALAMRGVGYSSKVKVLLPLAEKHLGEEVANAFRKLFSLYIKSEYKLEFLNQEEMKTALKCAKLIMKVYSMKFNKN
jgi:predicted nucleotidyltransferase